jgi:hypothetical protein
MTFQAINMDVTKSVVVNGETTREKIGTVVIHVPVVHDLVVEAVQSTLEGKPAFTDDGLPVYEKDEHNWLQSAIYAQVKAQARNKLVSKTATLKDGATIATDWAGLTAESAGGGAIHLQLVREVKGLFSAWVASLGKSQGAQAKITGAFNDLNVLKSADKVSKDKILGYLADFIDTLDDATQVKYNKYLTKVAETATADEIEADDF